MISKLKITFVNAFNGFLAHDALNAAAALAFYTALALAPLVLLFISLAGLAGYDIQSSLINEFNKLTGKQGGEAISMIILSARRNEEGGIIGTAISILVLAFSASAVFGQQYALSFCVFTILFMAVFKYLPDIRIKNKDLLIGACISSLLFSLGHLAIGLYLGNSAIGSAYGAAGSLIVVLVWVYYSSLILLFGAELTQSIAESYGTGVLPDV